MRKHLVVTVILLLSGTWASAQTVSGTIFGTVRDTSGALIPGVNVVATSVEMGTTRAGTTDSSGAYKIPGVPAGVYEVEASTKGFKTELRSGAVVTVGGTTAVDFVLKLGQMQEKVEVVASARQVETTNATISGLVGESEIRELPLNGRDWLQLATLQPGVMGGVGQLPASGSSTSSRSARGNGLSISISGGRGTQNVFLIDGLIVNDYANAGPGSSLGVNLGVDAIREFSVLTSNYSAEYGFGSGGMVNAILKSGTNQIHGGAFYFGRNSALDARNFFDPSTIPPFRRHQFGGAVGGPIKKDKTFFFANFEALRQFLSASEATDTLSPNARMGILASGNNVIVNPKIVPFLKAFPIPNGPITGDTGKFFFGGVEIGNEYYVVGKIDHNFSDKTTLNGSYSFDNAANTVPDPYNEKLIDTPSRRQNVVLSLQHIFSPALLNTLRAGVSRTHAADAFDLRAVTPNPLVTDPAFGFVPGLPAGIITVSGTSGFAGGLGASGADIYNYTAPQVSDDLTWIRGRHTMKFGFAVDRIIFNDVAGNTPNGEWDFGSISDFLTITPLDFTSDFPGTNGVRHLRTTALGAYVQDDFRVRPNLTLNLGLRYEMATVIKETNDKLANLRNLTDTAPVLGNPYFMNPTLRDFEPRVGFAWDLKGDGKSAVRGGFGIFDILPLPYTFINQAPRSLPFFLSGFVASPSGNAFPGNGLSLLLPTSLRTVFVEFRPPRAYNMNWNLNIQRQIANNLTVTIGYVGSSTVHSPIIADDINLVPPSLVQKNASGQYVFPIPASGAAPAVINPNFARIQSTLWNGKGNYHALLANLVKNFSHGVSFQVTYTWSRSFDEGSATFGRDESLAGVASPWPFDAKLNRGPSDYDVPQNLVLNYTWQVPRPSSIQSAVPKFLLSGWQLGGIYQAHSGTPFSITLTGDPAFTGTTAPNAERPNFNPGPGCGSNPVNPGQPSNYIKLQCFSFPAPGVLGNSGRNTLRGPFIHELDFSLFKNDVVLSDRLKIQFRIECFNLLNHANFQPGTPVAFDSSGNVTPAAAQIGPPTLTTSRQVQYGIKLSF